MQIYKNPDPFSPLLHFFGPNNLLPIMGTYFFLRQHLRRRLVKKYIIFLENSNIFVKAISSSVMWPLCYALLREMKHFSVLRAFRATHSQLGIHENIS